MFKYFFLVSLIFFLNHPNLAETNLQDYKTDFWEVVTDTPDFFAKSFTEYSENFSRLIYEYLLTWREDIKNLEAKIYLYKECTELENFLKKRNRKLKRSLGFVKISQTSWSEFTLAGCISTIQNTKFNFQKNVAQRLLSKSKKQIPLWLKVGFSDYFAYSSYIADDYSIVPHYDYDSILAIKEFYEKENRHYKISEILEATKILKNEKKFFFAYSWALFSYLFDVHPEGREFLKEYYKSLPSKLNIRRQENPKISEKSYKNEINEEDWFAWLNKLPEPRGFGEFKKLDNFNVTKSRIGQLFLIIQENPNFYLYNAQLSLDFYKDENYFSSIKYAEISLNQKLYQPRLLEIAIISSLKVDDFSRADYFFMLYDFIYPNNGNLNAERNFLKRMKSYNAHLHKYQIDYTWKEE